MINNIKTTKERLLTITTATVAVILVLSVIIGINYLLNKKSPTLVNNPIQIQPSEYPDYDAIKENPDPKIKSVQITINCPQIGCINNKSATEDLDGIKKVYKVEGEISRAYLYADLAVDGGRPLTSWDDFYFLIGSYGGHLIPDKNLLPTPPGPTTKYLFNLGSVSYYPTINDKKTNNDIKNIDIFTLLQDKNEFKVHAAISSNRPGRIMKEVSIYYECTESSDCSIKEVSI